MSGDGTKDGSYAQQTLDELVEEESNAGTEESDNPKPTSETQTNSGQSDRNLTHETEQVLNARQQVLYSSHISNFIDWASQFGKNPDNRDGLSERTTSNYRSRLDQIYRWIWDYIGEVPLEISRELADEFNFALNDEDITKDSGDPYSVSSKRKFNDTLRKYFEWRAFERDGNQWDPPIEFNDTSNRSADKFTRQERRQLREAVLEYDTIRSYSDCTPEQRSRLKRHIAQRLGKPKEEVTPADWERINNSWEKPSLIFAALDAGLRPVELKRATLSWLRLDKGSLHVPKEDSSKNRENWEVSLRPITVEALRRFVEEREHLERYDGSDHIWLTREANPWKSSSLNYLLRKLCEEAGIDQTNRRIVWYSIRHSVGQHMASEGGIEQANVQLRQKSIESTLQYAAPSLEERRSTLEDIG